MPDKLWPDPARHEEISRAEEYQLCRLLICIHKIGGDEVILLLKVYFETSFDSKQPKLEMKLVSALSITKRLFQLFRFYTESESFGVLIERKQTEDHKYIWYILVFSRKFRLFWFVLVCFETVLFVSVFST